MVEQDRLEAAILSTEGQDRQLGVERPGRPHGVIVGPDPVDRPVAEQQPAVLADRRFLAEPEEERDRREPAGGLHGRLDDLFLHLAREGLIALVAVDRDGRRGVVRVGRVDQDMVERDAGRLLDPPGGPVEDVALDHQHVAGDQGDPMTVGILDHHGRGAQLALLTPGLARPDPAADDHRIVGREDLRGRAAFSSWATSVLVGMIDTTIATSIPDILDVFRIP